MQNHFFSICLDFDDANDVVDRLLAAGIRQTDISVLTSEASGARHLAPTRTTRVSNDVGVKAGVGGAVRLMAEGLVTVVAAGVGLLVVGPLISALSGHSGAPRQPLADVLIGAGIPPAEARLYATSVAESNAVLIGVEMTDGRSNAVPDLMAPEKRRPGLLARA